jgi:SAM-dependent methyltransferase
MIKHEAKEDLWGYAKRLRFVRGAIRERFGDRAAATLSVLDVGCGNGSHLALPLVQDGFQITGIDSDEGSIEHARSMAHGISNARFFHGQVEALRASDQFDVVILSEVLEHLAEPQQLLAASAGHLAADGLLIVTVPNGYGEFEIDSWLFRTLHMQGLVDKLTQNQKEVMAATDNHDSGHVQFFTRRRLRRLFVDCDLAIVSEGAGSLLAGPIAGHLLGRSQKFIEWNARIVDQLPLVLSSSWYFALRRSRKADASAGPKA